MDQALQPVCCLRHGSLTFTVLDGRTEESGIIHWQRCNRSDQDSSSVIEQCHPLDEWLWQWQSGSDGGSEEWRHLHGEGREDVARRYSHDILTPTRSTRTTKSPISKKKGNGRKIKMILKILQLKSIREGAGRQSWEDQSKSKIAEAK